MMVLFQPIGSREERGGHEDKVNLSRPELARIISLVSLLLLSLVPAYIITSTSKGLVDALI